MTGTIVERSADGLVVDEGATRERQQVRICPRAVSRIEVRFPQLAPGQLVDVIGLRAMQRPGRRLDVGLGQTQ